MSNRYASLARRPVDPGYPQGPLDRLATPPEVTDALLDAVPAGMNFVPVKRSRYWDPILEPAAGDGAIVDALAARGHVVVARDILTGDDFLKTTRRWRGGIVTNPPYSGGRAEAFVRHALKIADGCVALLLETNFLHSASRASGLWAEVQPDHVLIIPWRIIFTQADGRPIKSQTHNHSWFLFADRAHRSTAAPKILIADPAGAARQVERLRSLRGEAKGEVSRAFRPEVAPRRVKAAP